MYSNNILIYLVVFLFIFSACREDTVEENLTGTLSGTVLAAQDGSAIENAAISTNPTTTSVNTDANGTFVLPDILIGTYAVIVSKEGFVANSVSLLVESNEVKEFTINLSSDSRFNKQPTAPEMISPGMDELITSFDTVRLSWSSTDADEDELLYSVRLYSEDLLFDEMILEESSDTSYVFTGFELDTRYFWQGLVNGEINPEVRSEVYSFRTREFPDFPYFFVRSIDGGLQILTTDNNRSLQLTEEAISYRPRVSNRGNQLAFISSPTADPHIYVGDDNGLGTSQVTDVPVRTVFPEDADFTWNITDTRVIYPNGNAIWSVRLNGTGLQRIAMTGEERFMSKVTHHPSENIIAYVEGSDRNIDARVILYDIPNRRLLDTVFYAPLGRVGGLDFSPDGQYLLFTHDDSNAGGPEGKRFDTNIYEHEFALDFTRKVSVDKVPGTNDVDPKYNSTGSKVVFTNQKNDQSDPPTIMQCNRDGTDREMLIENASMIGIRKF